MEYFQIKIPVFSKPRYQNEETDREYREDVLVFSVKAENETQAVSVLALALAKLVTFKLMIGTDRVYETL